MNAIRMCLMVALLGFASSPAPAMSAAAEEQSSEVQVTQNQAEASPLLAASQGEEPADAGLSVSLDVTAASKYLFQGIDYSDGKTVFQPNFAATFGAFSAVAWANYQTDLAVFNEVDLSLKYTGSIQKLSMTPGCTYLAYPNRDWDPSQELFLDLALDAPLSPSLSLHYDFDAGQGLYATLGMSHALRAPVTAGVNLFYQSQYYEMSGFPAAELKMSASLPVGAMSLTPQISYFFTWDNRDFRDEAGVPSTWYFSVNAALPVSF